MPSGGTLPHDLLRILLELDPLVGRLPDESVARPAGKLRADDEVRPEPVRVAARRTRWRRIERRRVSRESIQRSQQLGAVVVGEAGPDLARVAQRAAVMDADEQRAEVDSLARSRDPPADDQLLFGADLDLLPAIAASAREVRRAAVLGHDPLEPTRPRRLEERGAVRGDGVAQ